MKSKLIVTAVTLVVASSLLLSGSITSRAIDLGDILMESA